MADTKKDSSASKSSKKGKHKVSTINFATQSGDGASPEVSARESEPVQVQVPEAAFERLHRLKGDSDTPKACYDVEIQFWHARADLRLTGVSMDDVLRLVQGLAESK